MTNPIPSQLLEQTRTLTSGEVAADVHDASRRRLFERREQRSRFWQSPVFAGAVVVVVVVLIANASLRREPATAERAVSTEPVVVTERLSDADKVIASLRPQFRKCYQDGLSLDPNLAGKVVLGATVDPQGAVVSASVVSFEGLTPEVRECLVQVVRGAHFTGNGHSTELKIPVAFNQAR
jgi:hypothetical protein